MPNNLSKNWINMFDAIFYINMDKSTDRRAHIEHEFSHFKFDLIRVSAITPEKLGEKSLMSIALHNKSLSEPYRVHGLTQQNKNEIALGFSHSEAITKAIELYKLTGKSKILIIEDDAIITHLTQHEMNQFEWALSKFEEHDVWQLGYTIFTKNAGSWLTEREYSIKSESIGYGCATADKGIFGTLGYAINLNDKSLAKFEKFAHELKGSISDYCLSEQSYLKKMIYHQKLLLPVKQNSTISDNTTYSIVEHGYFINAFDEGFVKGFKSYDPSQITCHRENYDHRLAFLFVEINNSETMFFQRKYFDEHLDDIVDDARSLYKDETKDLNDSEIIRAFVVIFNNLSKPNLGQRVYFKQ